MTNNESLIVLGLAFGNLADDMRAQAERHRNGADWGLSRLADALADSFRQQQRAVEERD